VTRPLFEQYKDALRRGHLAARALQVDEALAAYADAARLAPARAAPHASSATLLHRAGREAEALAAFERGLAIAPDDEATLRARAAVYRDLGRLASAAADLERLALALDADGRRTDAVAAAREAVALTATAGRRDLLARLEAPEDDAAPRHRPSPVERAAAIARQAPAAQPPAAKRIATPSEAKSDAAMSGPGAGSTPESRPGAAAGDDPFATRLAGVPETLDEDPAAVEAASAGPVDADPAPAASSSSSTLLDLYDAPIEAAEPGGVAPGQVPVRDPDATMAGESPATTLEDASSEAGAATIDATPKAPIGFTGVVEGMSVDDGWSAPAKRSSFDLAGGLASDSLVQLEEDDGAAAIPWPAIDLPSAPPPPIVGPPPDPMVLMAEAHALIDAGNPKDARNLMLTAVMVHRAAGRPDAAIDVCLQLLALAPGDAHVHLAIAGLQLDRGWRTLATDKIGLLLRLTALTGDTQAEADAHALAAERLRDEIPASFARV